MRASSPIRSLRHLPLFWWSTATALAIAVGLMVALSLSHAHASASRFGGLTPVVVATANIEPGATLRESQFEVQSRPRSFLPDGYLAQLPSEATTVTAIVRGEVITETKLVPDGLGVLAVQLQPGQRAVTVAKTDITPQLQTDDLVDVVGTFATEDGGEFGAVMLTERARVIATSDTSVTVAVFSGDAARVAMAARDSRAALVVARAEG